MHKIFLYILLFIIATPLYSQTELDSLIVRLEKEMAKRDTYD